MRIVSLYPNFGNQGGAQDILLVTAAHLNQTEDLPIVLTDTPQEKIYPQYLRRAQYQKFSINAILKLLDKDTVFISHDRRYTSILVILNKIIGSKIQLVHIAHNQFFDKKILSFYPRHIIAVSESVKQNLIKEYKIPQKNITVIYNGIEDKYPDLTPRQTDNQIKILLPGRINKIKQQVKLVTQLQGKLNDNIEITFAGTGSDQLTLEKLISYDSHFKYIGHINIQERIHEFDYIMLFSLKEGLGMSLIEGCMNGKPLLTNSIGPVTEVNINGKNGHVYKNFEELANNINFLESPTSQEYLHMSINSREIYEQKFRISLMLEQYSKYIYTNFSNKI